MDWRRGWVDCGGCRRRRRGGGRGGGGVGGGGGRREGGGGGGGRRGWGLRLFRSKRRANLIGLVFVLDWFCVFVFVFVYFVLFFF